MIKKNAISKVDIKQFNMHMLYMHIVLCILIFDVQADYIQAVNNRVNKVLIFKDRAEVYRGVKNIKIPQGVHTVSFENIPGTVYEDSIQVTGEEIGDSSSHALTVDGVNYKIKQLGDLYSEKSRNIRNKIEQLNIDLNEANKKINRLNRQRDLIFQIRLDSESVDLKESSDSRKIYKQRNSQEINDIYKFIAGSSTDVDQETLKTETLTKSTQKEIDLLTSELNINSGVKSVAVIEVSVRAEKESTANLVISYQINEATWHPEYELILTTEKNKNNFNINTFGIISQSTGEDWNNVDLVLSTARPYVGFSRPEPVPKFLNEYTYPLPSARRDELAKRSMALKDTKMKAQESDSSLDLAGASGMNAQAFSAPGAPVEIAMNEAIVKDTGSVVFEVSNKTSIAGDGTSQKTKLESQKVEGTLMHISVPEISNEVFQEANLNNTGSSPLLPGEMNIISNGTFTGKKNISYIAKGETFQIPLGASDSFKVVRTLLKNYEDNSGLIRSFKRIKKDFVIDIENISPVDDKITVLEGMPVSHNEKIKVLVENISPEPLKDDNQSRINKKPGVFEWQISSKAKSKNKINYSTTLEYPSDIRISGE